MNVEQVMKYLGVCRRTIYNRIGSGRLETMLINGRMRITLESAKQEKKRIEDNKRD